MSRTVAIAPVRKTIIVAASQAHCFRVFTAGIDKWWPRSHGIGSAPIRQAIMEERQGGRFHMIYENDEDITTGTISVWEPPTRLVYSWDVNADWKPDRTVASEVELRFIAEGPSSTRVEMEHRNFEALGAEAGPRMAEQLTNGWPLVLQLFKASAEEAA